MKTKLTLSVDRKAVARVKRLAKLRGTSVSRLFENWSSRLGGIAERPSLGEQLRGRWSATPLQSNDPRLSYLLKKHTRR